MIPFDLRNGSIYLPAVPGSPHDFGQVVDLDDAGQWRLRPATPDDIDHVDAVAASERYHDEHDSRTSSCASCGADIVWLTMHGSGRRMPVDAKPAHTNVVLRFGSTGRRGKVGDVYLSHFATCPNARRHRQR